MIAYTTFVYSRQEQSICPERKLNKYYTNMSAKKQNKI